MKLKNETIQIAPKGLTMIYGENNDDNFTVALEEAYKYIQKEYARVLVFTKRKMDKVLEDVEFEENLAQFLTIIKTNDAVTIVNKTIEEVNYDVKMNLVIIDDVENVLDTTIEKHHLAYDKKTLFKKFFVDLIENRYLKIVFTVNSKDKDTYMHMCQNSIEVRE